MTRLRWIGLLLGIALSSLALGGHPPPAHAFGQVTYISRSYGPNYVALHYPGWIIGGISGNLYVLQFIGDGTWGRFTQAWNVYPDASPIPPGWVVTGTGGSFKSLECVVAAPTYATVQVLATSPVPANWVFLSVYSPTMLIRNVAGAATGNVEQVWYTSPVPVNWVILGANGFSQDIENVAGMPSGAVIQVTLTSPVPAGWTVIYRDAYSMQIRKT